MNGRSYNNSVIGRTIMEKQNEKVVHAMEELLKVSADATRLKIMFTLLGEGEVVEKCVSEIQNEIASSQSLVSHQLKVLRLNNLVKTRKEGTKVFYSLNDAHVKSLLNIVIEHLEEE